MKNTQEFMPWWKVEFGEGAAQAAYDAVKGRKMTMGSLTKQFEEQIADLLGVPFVISTCSGTAALSLALIEAGVGPGDEVIVPNRTWIATANAPHLLGAKVVFVDVEPTRPSIDVEAFEKAITPNTKAVLPVHLNGRTADIDAITAIADKHGIVVIEDSCQALFSKNRKGGFLGCDSRAGCFSLSIGKAISSGQGGFVVTRSAGVAKRLRMARTQGTCDVTMADWLMPGGNFRFWDLPAAVALNQLTRWTERCASVVAVYNRYKNALTGVGDLVLVECDVDAGELPLYVEYLSVKRGLLIEYLAGLGIQARPYYANLNTAPQFIANNTSVFPNSDVYASNCFVLPCGPDRTEGEIDRVVDAVKQFFGKF